MRFNTWERLNRNERKHRRGLTIWVALATTASIAALSGLVLLLPFG